MWKGRSRPGSRHRDIDKESWASRPATQRPAPRAECTLETHEAAEPDDISHALGVAPSSILRIGQPLPTSGRPSTRTMWQLQTGRRRAISFGPTIGELLARLGP